MHAVECMPVVVRPSSRSQILGPVLLLTFDISKLTRFLSNFKLDICKDSDLDEAPRMTASYQDLYCLSFKQNK